MDVSLGAETKTDFSPVSTMVSTWGNDETFCILARFHQKTVEGVDGF